MSLSDDLMTDEHDDDVIRQLRPHASAIASALTPISGSMIRRTVADVPVPAVRRRSPFLLSAAAVLALVVGTAVYLLDQPSAETQAEIGSAKGSDSKDVVRREPLVDLQPIQVSPAEFGSPELRYLPSSDSGFVVGSGDQVLVSEADLDTPVAEPERMQRMTMPAIDPSDRRSVAVSASTYPDPATADAVLAEEPTTRGVPGDPIEVEGRSGAITEEEAFAPFSAGTPMYQLCAARVRLDDTTILDVAAPDLPLSEIEALIASIDLSEDGTIEVPLAPQGFEFGEIIDGPSPYHRLAAPGATDYLALVLVGEGAETVNLEIFSGSESSGQGTAHYTTTEGHGWVEYSLFREVIVYHATDDASFMLASYDNRLAADDLIELAESMEAVDEAA